MMNAISKMRSSINAITLTALCACNSASAVTIDPRDDTHCAVLAFYFHGMAQHAGAPTDQLRAAEGLQTWYMNKMHSATKGRLADRAIMQAEIGPLLEAVKADPASMLPKAKTCADRATADPTFDDFAKSFTQLKERQPFP